MQYSGFFLAAGAQPKLENRNWAARLWANFHK